MLREKIYPKIEPTINRWVEKMDNLGMTPNQLTLGGLFLSLLAGMVFAKGFFIIGGLVLIGAGLGDMLDGALARKSGKASSFGAFLDSTLDRYSDFFIFCGISLYYAANHQPIWQLICLGIILGGFMVSYTKARAENIISACPVGIFNREVRFTLILLATIFTFLLKPVLVILFIGSHATALHRMIYTHRELSKENSGDSASLMSNATDDDQEKSSEASQHSDSEQEEPLENESPLANS